MHVVIDPVGGALFNEALRSVAWGAHVVVIGFVTGIPKVCVCIECVYVFVTESSHNSQLFSVIALQNVFLLSDRR